VQANNHRACAIDGAIHHSQIFGAGLSLRLFRPVNVGFDLRSPAKKRQVFKSYYF
jgi:hypothetical protein